ncbi:MAG: hypothetical protein HS104_28095 [Polyangiaceae bacterium]|nr:hypothetical protein [Polyangiaceae bacterium]
MSKTPPPMLGFNNNVRHHGRIFHIQTEDSGVKRPHIFTHLFGDGGRILKSVRTDYSEHVGNADMAATVKRMMKEQHKAMFVALRAGELDDVIEAAFGPLPKSERPSPAVAEELPSSPIAQPSPEEVAARIATPMPAEWREQIASAEAEPPEPEPEPQVHVPVPARPRIPTPPPPSHSIGSAVEAMAAKAAGVAVPRSATPLGTPLSAPSPLMRRRAAPGGDAPPGRYSISRPASIFGDAPPPDNRSIFGDPLIGEKSLDEVILSYLAEDLDSPQK